MWLLDILRKIAKKANDFESKREEVSMKAEMMTDEQLKTAYKRSVESSRSLEKIVYKKELESRGYTMNN